MGGEGRGEVGRGGEERGEEEDYSVLMFSHFSPLHLHPPTPYECLLLPLQVWGWRRSSVDRVLA